MLALFGGTFNPVHNGHISLALEVLNAFSLQSVEFLPSYIPVHRELPETSAKIRRQLLEIAIRPYPELKLNNSELERQGPSYAVDTLRFIVSENPRRSLCWLMGADSFNSFLSWKQPQQILQMTNLIVCSRPEVELDKSIFPAQQLQPSDDLSKYQAGKIVFYPMQPNHCSSTLIRQQLRKGESTQACLSRPVLDFIQQNNLYRN